MTSKLIPAEEVERAVDAFYNAHKAAFEAESGKVKYDNQTAMIVLANLRAAISAIPGEGEARFAVNRAFDGIKSDVTLDNFSTATRSTTPKEAGE